MESIIANELGLKLNPVVLIKSNECPNGALKPRNGVYFCVMSFFAQSVTKGKIIVFDRDNYGCSGACAGLGFGTDYNKKMGGYETFSCFFSKGIESAENKSEYMTFASKMSAHVREKLLVGERFHTSKSKAYKWITEDLPLFNFPERYRIIKPLSILEESEIPESVIFTVNPIQLTVLMTLVGSITEGVNTTITPQGAACQMIGNFVFNESHKTNQRAVLGLLDLAARYSIRNVLPNDVLTFSMPWNLFKAIEKEALTGIFQSPLWSNIK